MARLPRPTPIDEVAHLSWRSYGHRRVFFERVQRLLDIVAVADMHWRARDGRPKRHRVDPGDLEPNNRL